MTDNLLVDPVFRVRTEEGVVQASLPGVLATLGRDAVLDFPGLRPHQRHPWHAFLCQLAVMALEEAGENEWPGSLSEEEWRACIRGLTPDYPDDAPWRLVVADLARPAFLQPPVPEGNLKGWTIIQSCFDIDILSISKQHGEKGKLQQSGSLDLAVYSFVSLQSQSGHSAAGSGLCYYPTVRQSGTPMGRQVIASRPSASLVYSTSHGQNWTRDCRILMSAQEYFLNLELFHPERGKCLLWLDPWGGDKENAIPMAELHPLFIEISRRLRIAKDHDNTLLINIKGSKAPRLDAKEFNGAVGDPWIPIQIETNGETKAFHSKPHYSTIYHVMFDRKIFEPSLLQLVDNKDPKTGAILLFRVFLRTRKGSAGYHEYFVPIPRHAVIFVVERQDVVAQLAQYQAELASKAKKSVLFPAVLQLLQVSRESPEFKQPETAAWAVRFTDALDRAIDEAFFPALWDCLEAMGEASFEPHFLRSWSQFLIASVRNEFKRACASLPVSSALAYRAMAKAECLLEGSLRKNLVIKEAA